MAGRFVLALDAGGGGGGALVLDLDTGTTCAAHRPWTHPIAPGTGGWGYDFDCRGAWRALIEAAGEAMAAAGCPPADIAGIATTGMRHATVLIDADGREIFATPNRDARAAGQATDLASVHGADVYAKTGLWPAPLLP
jgi:sugar (pentulose or hexulose) kinase